MLIYDGKPNSANIAKAMLTMDELMEAVREHGVSDMSEVNLAILELDGNISVLSNDFQSKSTKRRKSKQTIQKNQ
ncbi:MAG: hypothetical protein H6Q59_2840 [Firmicutes bacterium]|nr:hypothetical protein [Bacillota bacterium]